MSESLRDQVAAADEELLATLGYKQEFQRAFSPLEVFGIAFSIIGLLPSIASVLLDAIPNGGPSAMVWGWAVASVFILFVGMSMAELASAAPTSGGLYFWTHSLSSPRWRNLLSWIVGYANTVGSIASVASINWGCAVQIMAAASIGSNQNFVATNAQTFGVYCLIMVTDAVICCLATRVLARLQTVYVILNVLLSSQQVSILNSDLQFSLPAATPKDLMNDASFALGNFTNSPVCHSVTSWRPGFAYILSFLAPLWTICSFDSAVHISEEAANAATAVPWAIVGAIFVAGVLGWACFPAINVSLAFCMGTDLDSLLNSPIGQPMATIFFNSFGQNGTLGVWAVVVIVQYMMGTSMLLASSRQVFAFSRDGALPFSGVLYRMNSHTKTPVNTVWFSAFLAGSSSARFRRRAGDQRRLHALRRRAPGPFDLGPFSFPCAVLSVSWMAFMFVVFLFPTNPAPAAPDMNYTIVVLGGVMVLSLVYYYFPVYGGVHWFTGPIRTVEEAAGRRSFADSDEKYGAESDSKRGPGNVTEEEVKIIS
ncbi:hypothetical protein EW145_g3543 [Phellinidium pouzarii]|uniref:Amino acid permease/ SLC12A domain-containing protein n=1 Tax=Phellinidium pouzarii TaxID=167371 RepID=A0A4S4L890_9AGAM|nr:hypothetical protein EW145_g3543 [Phellinidium pouzarii]